MKSGDGGLIFFFGAALGAIVIGYVRGLKIGNLKKQLDYADQRSRELERQKAESDEKAQSAIKTKDALHLLHAETISRLKDESCLLPSVVEWSNRIQVEIDELIEGQLVRKVRPAYKAAEEVREARAVARKWRMEAEILRNRVALYEAEAPWLVEFADCTLEDVLQGLKEATALQSELNGEQDPARIFVSASEWTSLSQAQRNQLALDRYWEHRKRNAWLAGIQYERFIGYSYEMDGFRVEYQGAKQGVEDLGIDLLCFKGKRTHVVQRKRLSVEKAIPVRENAIAQIYGATLFYAKKNGLDVGDVTPVLVTTFELSEQAKEFAIALGVSFRERKALEKYACIKCNISNATGEKIYHLPFDQQYDNTRIIVGGDDFYASTVNEAESKGFRRAYRWSGN